MPQTAPHISHNANRALRRWRPGPIPAAALSVGALLGAALALANAGAVATRTGGTAPILDVTHLPPLLTLPGEQVELRYDVHCVPANEGTPDAPCPVTGSAFVRPGSSGSYRELRLDVEADAVDGRYAVHIPPEVARARRGFTYYAVFQTVDGQATTTLPAGGAEAPQTSMPLGTVDRIPLGRHAFGTIRRADERVASAAWGDGPADVGLESGRGLPPTGASSFDVAGDGSVYVLDQVHRRALRWPAGERIPAAVPLAIDGTLADIVVAPDATTYVLEIAHAGKAPVLRAFAPGGAPRGATTLRERTASQVRIGQGGPVVHQQPSGQWVPTGVGRAGDVGIAGSPRPGLALGGGNELVVLRVANELRVAIAGADGVRRAWRVTSETPLGEVQLAEPLGAGALVVLRLYTDAADEFVALVLADEGLVHSFALTSSDWAETAPLSRFRLVGDALYQLGSTERGAFVDRYDLEVPR